MEIVKAFEAGSEFGCQLITPLSSRAVAPQVEYSKFDEYEKIGNQAKDRENQYIVLVLLCRIRHVR